MHVTPPTTLTGELRPDLTNGRRRYTESGQNVVILKYKRKQADFTVHHYEVDELPGISRQLWLKCRSDGT